jgi:hypothetical protein
MVPLKKNFKDYRFISFMPCLNKIVEAVILVLFIILLQLFSSALENNANRAATFKLVITFNTAINLGIRQTLFILDVEKAFKNCGTIDFY